MQRAETPAAQQIQGDAVAYAPQSAALSAAKIRVDSLNARGLPDGFALVTALIAIHNREELDGVMKKINSVHGVLGVRRA